MRFQLLRQYFAVEALERGIDLKEQHARVAQHRRCRLLTQELKAHCFILPAAHLDFVRRCAVLLLRAGVEIIAPRRHNGLLPNALAAAEGCQRGVRQRCAFRYQFFMDSPLHMLKNSRICWRYWRKS